MLARSDVYWVALDPTIGTEIQKTRPCVIVSPDELNAKLSHVIVAPITSALRPVPFRIPGMVAGRQANVVLDQLRAVPVSRFRKRIGKIDARTMTDILAALQAMFSP